MKPVEPDYATTMPKLSPNSRAKICEARSLGMPYKEIALRHNIKQRTAISTVKLKSQRAQNKSRPRSGRPRLINKNSRDILYELACINDNQIIWDSLTEIAAEEVGSDISKRTLQRLFKTIDARKYRMLRSPFLTPEYALDRLNWAEAHQHWSINELLGMIWRNECSIELGRGERPGFVFCLPGKERAAIQCLTKTLSRRR